MTNPVVDLTADSEAEYDFNELYKLVMDNTDIILTIPTDQVEYLKKGLSVKKSKENAKLKHAGLAVANDAFSFTVYQTDEQKKEQSTDSTVRIKLGPRSSITVKRVEIPDDSL